MKVPLYISIDSRFSVSFSSVSDGLHPTPSPRGQSPPSPHMGGPRPGPRASPSRDSATYSRESTPGTPASLRETGAQRRSGLGDGSPRKLEVVRQKCEKEIHIYAVAPRCSLLYITVSEIKGAPCAWCAHFHGRAHDFRRCAPGVCTFFR